ncbi:DUF1616 domain-containing protein [Chloroflexota bacterium]
MSLLEIVRMIFGGIFVLFVPGFCWSFLFFKRKSIDLIERIALSFGLSIALVPLTVFWLNWIFDMRITELSVVLTVCGLSVLATIPNSKKILPYITNITNKIKYKIFRKPDK